ncbi:MAG: tetratricopeptide repeat protein [Candidatus Wallbacteria bacterium]|nr:tetratricopeptide repeat protein [Candidatus Wallbacteria bacterium]
MKQIALLLMLTMLVCVAMADDAPAPATPAATPETSAVAAPAVTAPAATSPAAALIDEANKLMDQSSYEVALAKLAEAEKLDPKNSDIFRYQGYCYVNLKKYEDSIKAYDKCLELKPAPDVEVKAYLNKGECYLSLQKPEDAMKMFDKVIIDMKVQDPNILAGANIGKIGALEALGKTSEVLAALPDLIKLNPQVGNNAAGKFYYDQKDYQKAADAYSLSIAIDSKNPQVLYNCACCYALIKDAAKAIDCLTKGLAADAELLKEKGRNFNLLGLIAADPDFTNIKDDPAFKKLCPAPAGTGEVKGN